VTNFQEAFRIAEADNIVIYTKVAIALHNFLRIRESSATAQQDSQMGRMQTAMSCMVAGGMRWRDLVAVWYPLVA
jgi:hypothetical protein